MDTIELEDRRTGRVAVIRRPLADYVAPDELIILEDTVRNWGNVAAEAQADNTLDQAGAGSPERVLYGLLWLAGLWCALFATRVGIPVEDFISRLDYRGIRRDLSGMDEQMWTTVTELVRRGVLAVLTSDADIQEYLRIVKEFDEHSFGPPLWVQRRHLLTILDGLAQDMQRNDLTPWGAAAHVITAAGWAA